MPDELSAFEKALETVDWKKPVFSEKAVAELAEEFEKSLNWDPKEEEDQEKIASALVDFINGLIAKPKFRTKRGRTTRTPFLSLAAKNFHVQCVSMSAALGVMAEHYGIENKYMNTRNIDQVDGIDEKEKRDRVRSEGNAGHCYNTLEVNGVWKQYDAGLGMEDAHHRGVEASKEQRASTTWAGMASVLAEEKRFDGALKCVEIALKIDPKNEMAWNNKGTILYTLGENGAALACFQKAIEYDPDNDSAIVNSGRIMYEMQQYDVAKQLYDLAIEKNPRNANAWNDKGVVEKKLKNHEEALVCYEKALEITPDEIATLKNKTDILWILKRKDEARACIEKVLRLTQKDADAWNTAGGLLIGEDNNAALVCFKNALKIDPHHEAADRGKGVVEYLIRTGIKQE